jgi:serine/threonine-protein kinase
VAQAQQILQQQGFTNISVNGSTDPNAQVVQQNPGPNQPVDNPGATPITLTAFGGGGNNGDNNGGNGNGGFFH